MNSRNKFLLIVFTLVFLLVINLFLPSITPNLLRILNFIGVLLGATVIFWNNFFSLINSGKKKTLNIHTLNYQVVYNQSPKASRKAFEELIKRNTQKGARWKTSSFMAYADVWKKLQKISFAGDALWKKVDENRMREFANLTESLNYRVRETSLFLEKEHLRELSRILERFDKYWIGKSELFDLYRTQNSFRTIEERIRKNGEIKQEYELLLEKILDSYRKQLKET